jgi:hypothetical protein
MRNAHRSIAVSLAILLITAVAHWRRSRIPEPEWEPVLWLGSGLDAFPPNVELGSAIAIDRKGEKSVPWAVCEVPDGFAYVDQGDGMLHVCQRGRRSYVPLASIGRHAEQITDLQPAPDGLFLHTTRHTTRRIYQVNLKRREWKALEPDIVWAGERVLVTESRRVLSFPDHREVARGCPQTGLRVRGR